MTNNREPQKGTLIPDTRNIGRACASRAVTEFALVGGAIGFVLSIAGTVATWNRDLGPHWYAIAVALIALPCAWIGAKLRLMQLRG